MKRQRELKLVTLSLLLLLMAQPGFARQSKVAVTTAVTGNSATGNIHAVLTRYQLVLDQISVGHLTEARVLLEEGIRRYGNQPELSLLLAYLLEREGRANEARARLSPTAKSSPVAAAYVAALSRAKPTASSLMGSAGHDMGEAGSAVTIVANLPQSDRQLAHLEQIMLQVVNDERTRAGLNALTFDSTLADVARAHSAEMRDRKYFAHESPTPALRDPIDRYRAGVSRVPTIIAENIFRSWGSRWRAPSENDVKNGHVGLMNSPGHRANILRPNVTHIGIGIVANPTGDIWITQMFATP